MAAACAALQPPPACSPPTQGSRDAGRGVRRLHARLGHRGHALLRASDLERRAAAAATGAVGRRQAPIRRGGQGAGGGGVPSAPPARAAAPRGRKVRGRGGLADQGRSQHTRVVTRAHGRTSRPGRQQPSPARCLRCRLGGRSRRPWRWTTWRPRPRGISLATSARWIVTRCPSSAPSRSGRQQTQSRVSAAPAAVAAAQTAACFIVVLLLLLVQSLEAATRILPLPASRALPVRDALS